MSDAIRELHDYLAKSPSVVYPEDVLAYLPAIEAENAKLRERMAEPSGGARSIGSATVTVTPTLDWTGVARELRSIADALGSCNCTNSERTNETCHDLGGTGANDEVVDE